jgi:hypothetical protein
MHCVNEVNHWRLICQSDLSTLNCTQYASDGGDMPTTMGALAVHRCGADSFQQQRVATCSTLTTGHDSVWLSMTQHDHFITRLQN